MKITNFILSIIFLLMNKSKKIMFGIAVAAVASLNVYVANDVIEQRKATSLLNLENISEAGEYFIEVSSNGGYIGASSWASEWKTYIITYSQYTLNQSSSNYNTSNNFGGSVSGCYGNVNGTAYGNTSYNSNNSLSSNYTVIATDIQQSVCGHGLGFCTGQNLNQFLRGF